MIRAADVITAIFRKLSPISSMIHSVVAGELRLAGGYAKDTTPFSEFLWADFLRRRMKRQDVEKDFDGALEEALKLAKGTESNYLPGWCGPVTGD